MSKTAPLWYWINERHAIYLKREMGSKWPWTSDEVLQNFRFCNVFRELDTVTIWIRKNWRDKYAGHKNLWFAMCVARQINHIPTLKRLGFPVASLNHYLVHARSVLSSMHASGDKIYGAAYIITAGGVSGPKYLYTIDHVLAPLAANAPSFTKRKKVSSLESMWNEILTYKGFGPFISYEVVTDLRWTRYYNGDDHMTWGNPGPGALRGLARIYNGDVNNKPSRSDAITMMQSLLRKSRKPRVLHDYVPELEMRDIEHSLCETDKYLRAKTGEGRPKCKYFPPGEES